MEKCSKYGKIKLSKKEARLFLLAHQGLLPPRKLAGKEGILKFVERVGCIQFDPLDRVGRNSDLVLQARIDDYRPDQLWELLYEDRKLLDGLDKNMSIYRVEDWPHFTRYRQDRFRNYPETWEEIARIVPEIKRAFQDNDYLSSSDLEFHKGVKWPWGSTRLGRAALEKMYFKGELIIHHKQGNRKFYAPAEKHLPAKLLLRDEPNPEPEQFFRWIVKRRIGGVGLLWGRSGDAWLGIEGMKTKERKKAIADLLSQGEIVDVQVDGIRDPFFLRSEDLPLMEKVLENKKEEKSFSFLGPLDNLIWDRRMIKALFHYDYSWEVYKPASQRIYGYYVLPSLFHDRFVARFEPIFHRQKKVLSIENWWWEENVEVTLEMKEALKNCLRDFLKYLDAREIKYRDPELEKIGL